jgi:outer membrane phospholipase A
MAFHKAAYLQLRSYKKGSSMTHFLFTLPPVRTAIVLLLVLIPCFSASDCAAADGVTALLRFPQSSIRAGQPVLLTTYFHNEGLETTEFNTPDSLSLRIQDAGGTTLVVTAVESKSSPTVSLQPGEFLTKEYRIILPSLFQGVAKISTTQSPETAELINILPRNPVAEQFITAPETESEPDHYPFLESLFSLFQPYAVNYSTYEPTYFVVGTDPAKSRFQISFKYRLFNPSGSLSQDFPGLRGLYFAYTQSSFWDLATVSTPFEDTSYKPELFLLSQNWSARPKWMQGLFLQGGLQHESNGRGEDFSRSTNTFYIKPTMIFFDKNSELGLQISPKFKAYFYNDDDTNPDLPDYRGHAELELRLGKAAGLVLSTQLRFAEKGTSVQADLTYPISKLLKNNFDLFFQVQYSNSLAESMINYRQRTEAVRLGFSFVR